MSYTTAQLAEKSYAALRRAKEHIEDFDRSYTQDERAEHMFEATMEVGAAFGLAEAIETPHYRQQVQKQVHTYLPILQGRCEQLVGN